MRMERIFIDHVDVPPRLRAVEGSKVMTLVASIEQIGLQTPITVWAKPDDAFQLVAGAHRLAAAKHLCWEVIDAFFMKGDDIDRHIWEIDENLMRSELTPTQFSEHLAKRKELWEAKQEAKSGTSCPTLTGRGNTAYASETAKATGVDKRTINRAVSRAEGVCQEARDLLRGTRLDTGVYLDQIKKLEPADQVAKVQADLVAPPKPKPEAAVEVKPSQAPTPEAIEPEDSPEVAKLRKLFRSLTPEAQEDEYLGLHADLADLKRQIKDLKAERDGLKSQLSDLTADDKDEVIRRLTASVKTAENAKWRATEEQGRAMKQVYALKKRVEELEQMGVVKL